MDISNIRAEYSKKELRESNVASDPISQFKIWFGEALESEVAEPNAMHLATINSLNRPSGRVVLLKSFDATGFVFYTNYNSRKATEMAHNAFAAITFFWPELERQVRIEGLIQKNSEFESEKYFQERPRLSQIGAWASPQSQILPNRTVLEENFNSFQEKFGEGEIPKPQHWGGYILKPDYFEYWQGRRSRLHDRIIYTPQPNNEWAIKRLAP